MLRNIITVCTKRAIITNKKKTFKKVKIMINLNLLKIFLRGNMSFEFKNIKVADIEKEISLKNKGESDGKNNLPSEMSEVFSITENEAITKYDEKRHESVSDAAKYLEPIKNKIIGYASILGKKHFFIDSFKNRVEQSLTTADGRLSNLKNSYDSQNEEVKHFKLTHDISRDPKSLTTTKFIGGILFAAALFFIEVRVNTKLLGPAMTGGEAEGQGISFAVAALNVIISFLAGYFLVKNFNLHKSIKKTISKVILAFYSFFIIYLNWCLGAFRAIAEQKGQVVQWGQTEAVVSQAADFGNVLYPWTVTWSFYAAVLTCVGIVFALLSLLDGYYFDDPYPGYGSVGKNRNDNKKEIDRIREHIGNEVNVLFKAETQKISDERDLLISENLKQWSINVTKLESTFANYRRYAKKIDDDTDHIIEEYRITNSNFRNTPAPKYWKDKDGKMIKEFKTLSPDKIDPKLVFSDMAQLYLDKNEIEEKNKSYSNNLNEEAQNFVKELNTYKEEVNKKIEDLRSKYHV